MDTGLRLTISAAGSLFYYTGSGLWWLGKRAIYGRQPTVEEQQVLLIQQNKDLTEQVRLLKELVESREETNVLPQQPQQQSVLQLEDISRVSSPNNFTQSDGGEIGRYTIGQKIGGGFGILDWATPGNNNEDKES